MSYRNSSFCIFFPCLIFAYILFFSCTSDKKELEKEKRGESPGAIEEGPAKVKVQKLDYCDFYYEILSNGLISATNKAELRFQSQDIITKIYVKNGQYVKKGQRLAELDKFKLNAALDQAREALERTKLDLQDVLIGQGYSIGDSARVPDGLMKIAKIRSGYEQSRNNFITAKHNLDAATLYAPFDGVVANLSGKEYNQPGGEPFCVVIDNQRPEVVFNILESELPLINLNDKVIVSPFSQPEYSVEGRISEINPMIDKNGMIRVKALVSNRHNKLYEGMNIKVSVQRLLGKQLVIPKSALVMRTNKKVVFTLKGGKAVWNYVETAQENSGSYVVTSGLNAGDSVIYTGNLNLAHEAPVMIE